MISTITNMPIIGEDSRLRKSKTSYRLLSGREIIATSEYNDRGDMIKKDRIVLSVDGDLVTKISSYIAHIHRDDIGLVTHNTKMYINPTDLDDLGEVDGELWFEYDDRGNEVYHKANTLIKGRRRHIEQWREYDDRNNMISFQSAEKGVKEDKRFYTYDENNNRITSSYGTRNILREYNTQNKLVKYTSVRDGFNYTKVLFYDMDGNLIREKIDKGDGTKFRKVYDYDMDGNLIYTISGNEGTDETGDDANPNGIHEEWYGYNEDNRIINRTSTIPGEPQQSWEYDDNGNMIRTSLSNGEEYTYTYNDEGILTTINYIKANGHVKNIEYIVC